MKKISIHIFCFFLSVGFFAFPARSQDNTLYMLHQLPQANMLNPAVDFRCKFYIELPVISSIKFNYHNTSFSYRDFIRQGTGSKADSLIFDFDNIYPKLRRNNAIYSEIENVIIGAGFHWKKYFITARIYHAHQAGFFYNKELITMKDGNWDINTDKPVNFDLKRNEGNAISYIAYSVGVSRQFSYQFRLGASISYLQGMLNYNTKQSELNINTTEQPVTVDVNTNYNSNVSAPLDIERDANGNVDRIRPVTDNFVKNYIFNGNRGLKLDLGAVYNLSENTTLAASILNLGFIRWKSSALNLKATGNISLSGVSLDGYTNGQAVDLINMLRDTVLQSLNATDSPTKYFTPLPVKVFAGVTQKLSTKVKAGLVSKIYIFNFAVFPSLTATINVKPVKYLDLSGSLSYVDRSLRNIGFAVIVGGERVNFYISSDMMPIFYVQESQSGLIFPQRAKSVSVRFGFNLMFGCKKVKKVKIPGVCPAYD
ncbi:MAG: DUF5723 family protein [Bacteroidales bacterium]